MKIYAIFDTGVKAWNVPLFVQHPVHAQRFFETLANDPTSDVGRYPEQFCLFEMGEFDTDTGEFSLLSPPISLGLGSRFVNSPEVQNAS